MRYLFLLLFLPSLAFSQTAFDPGLFVNALKEGKAAKPYPVGPKGSRLVDYLSRQSGSTAPFEIQAERLTRFKQQVHCGRVVFAVVQPEAHRVWPQLGGQLNICEDGRPPWQVCKENSKILVPFDSHCHGDTKPVNTPEIDDAINTALQHGGLTAEQANDILKSRAPKRSTQ